MKVRIVGQYITYGHWQKHFNMEIGVVKVMVDLIMNADNSATRIQMFQVMNVFNVILQ